LEAATVEASVKLYTTNEVAALTGRSRQAVAKLAKERVIGAKLGRDWFFTETDIAAIRAIDIRGGRRCRDGSPPTYKTDVACVVKGRRPRVLRPVEQTEGAA
jgi:hypothetical protein